MLNWITRLMGLRRRYRPPNHFEDIPGSYEPTLDDLRAETIEFERQIKAHIKQRTGKTPKGALGQLIHDVLPKYPKYPEHPEFWDEFLEEVKALKTLRNSIAHSDIAGLPSLPEMYQRFKRANDTLRPFTGCSVPRDRFTELRWERSKLNFKIDEQLLKLSERDVENLLIELHPASRGKVYFKQGKKIRSAVLQVEHDHRTYFIEGCEAFILNDQEAMALDDLLICFLGNLALRRP
ncbi:hypothetical protein PS631_01719 [Pseudomonas fluorescens]|uniref:Uncharacterized protein n=1 Tax=Pseudomonas fluorescens TaxID=294 RepID=A0A5E6RLL5_PSEFL|nr:hypothetical protein [Pseudomonas fluorescens]VVM69289.1 hypothetical protein PS631_01719 [Pseudomonas fluorescens]